MRTVSAVSKSQMKEWEEICRAFAKKVGAKLVFVNSTSCGVEYKDGRFEHIYIDEMQKYLNK